MYSSIRGGSPLNNTPLERGPWKKRSTRTGPYQDKEMTKVMRRSVDNAANSHRPMGGKILKYY